MTARGTTRRWPRAGVLAILAGLMIASATLRLLSGADAFIAQAAGETEPLKAPEEVSDAELAEMLDDEPMTLLDALNQKEARLKLRERKIIKREKALELSERAVKQQLIALEDAEERLRRTISLAQGAAEADVAGLTEVYSRMKPKNAAALFTEMAPDFAAGFLARMRPEVALAIMAGLPPDQAYAISAILAARNSDVPTSRGPAANEETANASR